MQNIDAERTMGFLAQQCRYEIPISRSSNPSGFLMDDWCIYRARADLDEGCGGAFMSLGFLTGIAAAQGAAASTKPANRRHRVRSIVGGIALTLLIGGALVVVALVAG
jgi:hypothetical protein